MFDYISISSSWNKKCFGRKLQRKSTQTFRLKLMFFFENHAIYEIRWKNIVESDMPQKIIWRMRIGCWITKFTNTISEYIILGDFYCNSSCTNACLCYVYTHIACLDDFIRLEFRTLPSLPALKGVLPEILTRYSASALFISHSIWER